MSDDPADGRWPHLVLLAVSLALWAAGFAAVDWVLVR